MLRTNPEPALTPDTAKLPEIIRTLANGGHLEFTWITCVVRLFDQYGLMRIVDGRSYQAFCKRESAYKRIESGQDGDNLNRLIITWVARK